MDKNASESKVIQDQLGSDITETRRWLREIEGAKKANQDYWKACDAIVAKYKDSRDAAADNRRPESQKERKYNVLWSITQTLQPLIYGEPPRPFVNRRYKDLDAAARDASMVIQRSLEYDLEGDELHLALEEARDDLLLCGRGVIWARYKPFMELRKSSEKVYLKRGEKAPEGATVESDNSGKYYHALYEKKIDEEVDWEHIHYRSFLHGSASKWKHVPWVARCVYLTREELIARFGEEIGEKVPLSVTGKKDGSFKDGENENSDEKAGLFDKAEVWEIWSKHDKKVRWICPQWDKQMLDVREDFLQLRDFYPCPRPVYATKTNESLIPQPDYRIWQGVAMELDEVTWRIKLLTESLRVVGIYDKSLGDVMKRLTQQTGENDMIPVDGYAMVAEKGGIKGAIEFFPIEQVMVTLQNLHQARQQLLQELYDLTGISDILRGATDPRETAKAQQIKGNAANRRVKIKQNSFMRFVREALEIHTEIMCSQYSEEQLRVISNADEILIDPMTRQLDPRRAMAALQLLKSAPLRRFRVKVSEKTLATQDVNEDLEERQQYLMSIAQMIQSSAPLMEANEAFKPLFGELLLYAVRGFPNAKTTEASIEAAIRSMIEAPPPPPEQQQGGKSPEELQIEQQRLQLEMKRLELDSQYKMREIAVREQETQIKAMEMQLQDENRKVESQIRVKGQEETNAIKKLQIMAQAESMDKQLMGNLAQAKEKQELDEQEKIGKLMAEVRKLDLEERKMLLDAAAKADDLDAREDELQFRDYEIGQRDDENRIKEIAARKPVGGGTNE